MKILVILQAGNIKYIEDVTDQIEMEPTMPESWYRELDFHYSTINKYNTNDVNGHFIFGWMEAFEQSSTYIPEFMFGGSGVIITVKHE